MGIERRPADADGRSDWLNCYGMMPFWTGCQLPSGNRMDGIAFYLHEKRLRRSQSYAACIELNLENGQFLVN
jgi:hypothetical protein